MTASQATGGRASARAATAGRRPADVYLAALLLAVAAYACMGRGFAYAGLPPVFPGEVLLLAGLATLALPKPSVAVLASPPHLMLCALMVWTLARTLPFIGLYGADALRDSVIVMYGLFAFVVTNLILEDPARIGKMLGWAARFFSFYGASAVVLYLCPKFLAGVMPHWPLSDTPLVALRGGEVAVHLGGAATFALLGLKRSTLPWAAMTLLGMVVVSAQSRGGMLAMAVPLLIAIVVTGRIKAPALLLVAALPILSVLYVTDFEFPIQSERRSVTVAHLIDNTASIFFTADRNDNTLDDTKAWRLRWWDRIIGYTVHGPYFWTGKGFGINIAESDGYSGFAQGGPALRSPHSAHMTLLARGGLPGLAMWVAVGLTWLWTMLRRIYAARLAGDDQWSRVLLFVLCEWVGVVVDASFDVALEGPMLGIVFWTLFGTGVGLSMTYDAVGRGRALRRSAEEVGR